MRLILLSLMISSLNSSPLCRSLHEGKCYLCQHSVHEKDSCVPKVHHAAHCLEYDFPKLSGREARQNSDEERGVCVKCAYGYRLDETKKTCVRCADPRCVRCDSSEKCSVCYDNKLPFEGRCKDSKIIGKDPNCLVMTGEGCALCQESFAFDENGECRLAPPLCQEVTADRICATCLFGAYMDEEGNCNGDVHPLVFETDDSRMKNEPEVEETQSHHEENSAKSGQKSAENVETPADPEANAFDSTRKIEGLGSEGTKPKKKKSEKDMNDIKWKTFIGAIACLIFYSACNYFFTRRQVQPKLKGD